MSRRQLVGYLLSVPAVCYYGWFIAWKLVQWCSPSVYRSAVGALPALLRPYYYDAPVAIFAAVAMVLAVAGLVLAGPRIATVNREKTSPSLLRWLGIFAAGWCLHTMALETMQVYGKAFASTDRAIWSGLQSAAPDIVRASGDPAWLPWLNAIDGPGEEIVLCGLLVTVLLRHTRLSVPAIIAVAVVCRAALHMNNDALLQACGYATAMAAVSAAFFLRYRSVAPLVVSHLAWNVTTTHGLAPEGISTLYREPIAVIFAIAGILILTLWFAPRTSEFSSATPNAEEEEPTSEEWVEEETDTFIDDSALASFEANEPAASNNRE
ncbi:MAG: CPBP family glutamic-type intramembrane protease [Actinomycetaceae bacterium]|nr:CPBP family glutamic-type intramembrane protease [Actinomycetaceae bacterium]